MIPTRWSSAFENEIHFNIHNSYYKNVIIHNSYYKNIIIHKLISQERYYSQLKLQERHHLQRHISKLILEEMLWNSNL